MASVTLSHLFKRFPAPGRGSAQTVAVNDLNLDIRDREFMVLVGPSGCGKTTALRMIAGLEEISDGDIRIGERVVNAVSPKDRDIAMVFQNYALYPAYVRPRQHGLRAEAAPHSQTARIDQPARRGSRLAAGH